MTWIGAVKLLYDCKGSSDLTICEVRVVNPVHDNNSQE